MFHQTVSDRDAHLIAVRDEEMIRSYFDYYLHQHRLRKGEAQSTGRIISPTTAGFPADKVRHRILQPGTLFAKQQAPKEVDLPPVTPTFRIQDMEKAPRASGEGAEEWNLPDDLIDSEVDEVIMVRKLGAIESLRSRRQDVLKDLELVRMELFRELTTGSRQPCSPGLEGCQEAQGYASETGQVIGDDNENASREQKRGWDTRPKCSQRRKAILAADSVGAIGSLDSRLGQIRG